MKFIALRSEQLNQLLSRRNAEKYPFEKTQTGVENSFAKGGELASHVYS